MGFLAQARAPQNMRRYLIFAAIFGLLGIGIVKVYFFISNSQGEQLAQNLLTPSESISVPAPKPQPTPTPSPTPKPTPDPKIYGPCKNIPVTMYHHVEPETQAKEKHQKALTVDAQIFATQMDYLAKKGYKTLTPDELLAGLASGLPARVILLSFDDGYADFYQYAYPELVKHNFRATVFLPTGLVGNSDYLTWDQIAQMASSGLITFANHTWSHKSLGAANYSTASYEVQTAQKQLEQYGLGTSTSFAYPYGTKGKGVEEILKGAGIKMAFTTAQGSYQCAKLPYDFERIRIGNSSLASYGL